MLSWIRRAYLNQNDLLSHDAWIKNTVLTKKGMLDYADPFSKKKGITDFSIKCTLSCEGFFFKKKGLPNYECVLQRIRFAYEMHCLHQDDPCQDKKGRFLFIRKASSFAKGPSWLQEIRWMRTPLITMQNSWELRRSPFAQMDGSCG